MECQHLLVEVYRRRCARQAGVKVIKISPGFVDVSRRTVGVKNTMTSYDSFRMQSLDLIQRAQPFDSGLFIALREIGVRVVIDGISRYHQANRRNMQRGCVLRVGMAKLYYV